MHVQAGAQRHDKHDKTAARDGAFSLWDENNVPSNVFQKKKKTIWQSDTSLQMVSSDLIGKTKWPLTPCWMTECTHEQYTKLASPQAKIQCFLS